MNNLNTEEIRKYIEIDCKDWIELKVINIEHNENKVFLKLKDNYGYRYYSTLYNL